MKHCIHRLAACIISFALLLTFCPMMGSAGTHLTSSASTPGQNIQYAPESGGDPSTGTGSLRVILYGEGAPPGAESEIYNIQVAGPNGYITNLTIPGYGSMTASNLEPGVYTVTEIRFAVPDGYTLDIQGEGSVTVEAGQEAEIRIVHYYGPTPPESALVDDPVVSPTPSEDVTDSPSWGSLDVSYSCEVVGNAVLTVENEIHITGPDGYSQTVPGGATGNMGLQGLTPGVYTVTMTGGDISGYTRETTGGGEVVVEAGEVASVSFFTIYTPEPTPEPSPSDEPAVSPPPVEMPSQEPSPTPSDEPTPTPIETTEPEPSPSDTPMPSATPEHTPTPLETPRPAPTPSETPEPEPSPSATPTPSATPEPTPSATPEPTAEPTPEPTPSGTPESTPTPTPTPAPTSTPTPTPTRLPDVTVYIDDRDENIKLPVRMLDEIEDAEDAVEAVQELVDRLTPEQKLSHTAIDIATLFAERAAALTAVVDTNSQDELLIDAALLHQVEETVKQAAGMVGEELENNGVDVDRKLPKTIILYVGDRTSFVAKIDPDVLTTDVDKVRVETDRFAITFKLEDLAADLNDLAADQDVYLQFKAEEVGDSETTAKPQMLLIATPKAAGNKADSGKLAVRLTMPEGGITNPITLSLSSEAGESQYQTMTLNDAATPSKFNPVTITMDSKTITSGAYTTETNEVDFTDIEGLSAEMQAAIKNLASKGVLVGTTATTFSPEETLTRGQIAILLSRVLGLYDERATTDYTDVTKANWYYVGAASCQKANLMSGVGGGRFNGDAVISKGEIIAAGGNVLMRYMDYETPANLELYLGRYSDDVPTWGRESIAVATQENIVVYRTDGQFLALSDMTRGDAAIVINRLFSRIW